MNEKYIPLYRKYRPQKLNELVGQEHIKRALSNSIEMDKIAHAYLFTGPRGTGKTSTARIFAKSLNCMKGPTAIPCDECENCRNITNSTPMDVIEIDAASNRKVEDAQNILEKVMYAPVSSRYKIYIIDEVHMLSSTAFNALLKTLEEPPKNVIFILATTEVHKVLDTIKSRCQRFDFRRITTNDIVQHLRFIADAEKINITDDALYTIAKNSAGGMRDSIALLDQLSVLGAKDAISTEDINALLGRISFDVLKNLADSIVNSSPNDAIEILEKIYNSGNEPVQILQNLLDYLKNLLIVKNCRAEIVFELTQMNDLQIKELKAQSELIETHQIVALSEKCSSYIKEVKTTNNPRLWLEVGVMDMANLSENTTLSDLQTRLTRLEGGETPVIQKSSVKPVVNMQKHVHEISKPEHVKPQDYAPQKIEKKEVKDDVNVVPVPEVKSQVKAKSEIKSAQPETKVDDAEFSPMPKAHVAGGEDIMTLWGSLLANVQSPPTRALLKQWANPIELTPEKVVVTIKNEIYLTQFVSGNKKAVLQNAIDELFSQKDTKITVRLPQSGDAVQSAKVALPKPKSAPPVSREPIAQTQKNAGGATDDVIAGTTQNAISEAVEDEVEDESKDLVEISSAKVPQFASNHSDTVNMVMDIFDGKIID